MDVNTNKFTVHSIRAAAPFQPEQLVYSQQTSL
jgi:hypothetical protein